MVQNKPPSFLLRFVGKDVGTALLHWLEITRSRMSLRLQMESSVGNVSTAISFSLGKNTSTSNGVFDCPYRCPELNACINDSLWCDGRKNCPSGFDELESHCDLKYKMIRNYVILSIILAVIIVLTVFILVATIKRFRFSSAYIDSDTLPKRITTEETLYDQSTSTISS